MIFGKAPISEGMGCLICLGVFVLFIAGNIVASKLYKEKPSKWDDYREGSYDFSPFGEFIISGRLVTTGQWVRLAEVKNEECEYKTEGAWMEAAVEKAKTFNDPKYQDIKVYYYDLMIDQFGDMERKKTVWMNGEWK